MANFLRALAAGGAAGLNFAGENLQRHVQQKKDNKRRDETDAEKKRVTERTEGRQDTIWDRQDQEYDYTTGRRTVEDAFSDDASRDANINRDFDRSNKITRTPMDNAFLDESRQNARDDRSHMLERRPIVEGFSDRQSEATIGKTEAGPKKGNVTQGSINAARDAGISRNLNLSLADLSNAARQGRSIFGDEDITDIFDDLPDDYREMLPSELANAFTEAGYEVGMIPSLDSMMQKAMQYEHGANIDIQKLEAVRNAPPPASTITPEAIESRRGIQGMRQQYSDQR